MSWLGMAIIGAGVIGFVIVYIEVCIWIVAGTAAFKRMWGLKMIPLLINELKAYKELRAMLLCLVLLGILVVVVCTGKLGSLATGGFWWVD